MTKYKFKKNYRYIDMYRHSDGVWYPEPEFTIKFHNPYTGKDEGFGLSWSALCGYDILRDEFKPWKTHFPTS